MSEDVPRLRLKPGKERALLQGHPWIFSGALHEAAPSIEAGTVVEIEAADGTFVARGYFNPRCSIAVRVLTRGDESIDADFVRARVEAARAWRARCVGRDTNAYRLLNGEGDGLPGVVADVYGEYVVLQTLTAGAERFKPLVLDAIVSGLSPRGVFERSTGAVRREEGLAQIDALAWGEEPPEIVEIVEHGHRFGVDLRAGQKTGFFLDQRPNRVLVEQLVSGARVLNAFGYTGGFAVYAAAGGAESVVTVETSARALEMAHDNWMRNGLDEGRGEFVQADVFEYLRRTEGEFDLVVLDPPALVKRRGDAAKGARAYKDLNLQAFKRVAPGGLVVTFTCSQHVDADFFRKIVRGAAADAQRDVQVLQLLGPGPDHPTALAHPEGEYLHGLLLRVR